MKMYRIVLVTLLSLLFCNTSKATITNILCYDDYSGAFILHSPYTWDANSMQMTGDEYDAAGPGRIIGDIFTDTAEDPTLTLRSTIDNDTSFAWSGFHVEISLSSNFTIAGPTVFAPGDWTGVITSQPLFNGTSWVGQLDFAGGAPIAPGGTLDFSYSITFSGSTHFSFTQDMNPIAVPEPSALPLAAIGGFLLLGVRMARRQACR